MELSTEFLNWLAGRLTKWSAMYNVTAIWEVNPGPVQLPMQPLEVIGEVRRLFTPGQENVLPIQPVKVEVTGAVSAPVIFKGQLTYTHHQTGKTCMLQLEIVAEATPPKLVSDAPKADGYSVRPPELQLTCLPVDALAQDMFMFISSYGIKLETAGLEHSIFLWWTQDVIVDCLFDKMARHAR
jgi:hypothetical protein